MKGHYRIVLFTEFQGKYIEQSIYGYETESDAWQDFDKYLEWMESSLGWKCDGTVYKVTDEDIKRLKL